MKKIIINSFIGLFLITLLFIYSFFSREYGIYESELRYMAMDDERSGFQPVISPFDTDQVVAVDMRTGQLSENNSVTLNDLLPMPVDLENAVVVERLEMPSSLLIFLGGIADEQRRIMGEEEEPLISSNIIGEGYEVAFDEPLPMVFGDEAYEIELRMIEMDRHDEFSDVFMSVNVFMTTNSHKGLLEIPDIILYDQNQEELSKGSYKVYRSDVDLSSVGIRNVSIHIGSSDPGIIDRIHFVGLQPMINKHSFDEPYLIQVTFVESEEVDE